MFFVDHVKSGIRTLREVAQVRTGDGTAQKREQSLERGKCAAQTHSRKLVLLNKVRGSPAGC